MAAETVPLRGLHVVDFGQYIAGPMVALNLADNGAGVTHVNPPAGPSMPGPMTEMLNRGALLKNCISESSSRQKTTTVSFDDPSVPAPCTTLL